MKNRLTLFIILILLFEGAYFLLMADMMHLDVRIGNEYSMYKILGKSAQMAEPGDIEKLKKSQLMQLFFAANTPEVNNLSGKFQSKVLDSGLNDKQLKVFFFNNSNTDSYIAESLLDNRKSLHLNFQLTERGIKKSEHDEIRKINENLYICMIYTSASKRPENPIPVMLVAKEWKR